MNYITSRGRINSDHCSHCDLIATSEGHDGCLGTIHSGIWNACCGHGERDVAYIQFSNGAVVDGESAITLLKFLKPSIGIN